MTMRHALSLRIAAAVAVAAVAAVGASTASAHGAAPGPGKYLSSCPTYSTTQPFLPWADPGDYFIGPGGDFEGSLTGWVAKGSPKIVSGNETYYVDSATDSHSLSMPKGSMVTSPSVCVTLDTPDLRVFLNNKGKPATVTVAKITLPGKSGWTLSAPVLFLANIQAILSNNNQTWVTFQFAANGAFLVDDFYVDPVKHH
jgi:hypothetical protein